MSPMGGIASLYWREMRTSDGAFGGAPWFESDSKSWADWIAAMHAEENVSARASCVSVGLAPLLSATTDGQDDAELDWTTPTDLEAAARRALLLLTPVVSAADELLENDDAVEAMTSAELHRALEEAIWRALDRTDPRFAAPLKLWFGLFPAGEDPSEVLACLVADLESVAKNAAWAREKGIKEITMLVNW